MPRRCALGQGTLPAGEALSRPPRELKLEARWGVLWPDNSIWAFFKSVNLTRKRGLQVITAVRHTQQQRYNYFKQTKIDVGFL